MQFAGNRRQLARIGKVVDENPPGVTMCANGRWSTNSPAPGVCSYNGGWIVNYPNLSRTLQAKATKKPSALVLQDAPAADPAPMPPPPAPVQQPEGLTLQTPTNGVFAYEVLYRPFDSYTVPKGFIKHEQSGDFFGIVTYPEPLTLAQIKKWELRPAWWPTLPGRSLLVLNDEEILPGRIKSVVKNGITYSFDFEGVEIEETYNVWEFLERLEAGEFIIPITEKQAPAKPSALVLQDAPAADPAPVEKTEKQKFEELPVSQQIDILRDVLNAKFPNTVVQQLKQTEARITNTDEAKQSKIRHLLLNLCEYGDNYKPVYLDISDPKILIVNKKLFAGIVFCKALKDYIPPAIPVNPAPKPSALILQDAPAADPAPAPVKTIEEPEEDITDGPHWRIDPKRKAELHLGYDYYKKMPSETQREIKRFFTWSRGRQAWVSKGRYDSWSVDSIIKKLNIPLAGKDERMSFADRMKQQKENAEYRAERMEDRIQKSKKKQEELQAEFQRLRKDWSWVTQPNVNTSRGRAFTRQREKVYNRYEKGFEEARRREQLYDRMEAALTTAQQWKLKDSDYLQRKIKENQKSVKARTEQLEKLQERLNRPEDTYGTVYRDGERRKATKEDVLEAYEWTLEKYQEAAEQLAFFSEALDKLIKEKGIVIYNKENLKGAAYVNAGGDWYKVIRVNPTTVTHSWFVGTWKRPHTEILDVVYEDDDFEVIPKRENYAFSIKRKESISGTPARFRTLKVLNI